MYGFCRPKDSDQNVYIHPRFQKGNLNSMKLIKRKVGQPKSSEDSNSNDDMGSKQAYESNRDDAILN
jgi:hypothetical protein